MTIRHAPWPLYGRCGGSERLVLVVGHGACKERVVPRRVGLLQCDATARRTLVVTLSPRGRAAGLVALGAVRIVVLVERGIAFAAQQQAQDQRIDVLDEGQGQLSARLDRAAGVVGGLVRSVKALEQRLSPGNVLSEEQAAEVSDQVKTVAEALTARDVAAGVAPRDWYGSIYRTLYKRYNVAGYRRIRQEQYADVLSWLDDFHETASRAPQANGEE